LPTYGRNLPAAIIVSIAHASGVLCVQQLTEHIAVHV
jgi:hypothetical protein